MSVNPILGVFFHWLGGLASGSFYVPYRGVKKWAWETYWLVGGFFSWIICPWILAAALTEDLAGVLLRQNAGTLWWTYFFGLLWGFGGLSFGLTMRYLGMSLGMGIALGFCSAFGTLLPPLLKSVIPSIPVPETLVQIAATRPGQITLAGVGICLVGIGLAALAGLTKEREMPAEEKKKAIAEFNFSKGILIATFSGVMSACFAFGLTAGNPIGEATLAAGTPALWSGLPKLVIVLLGGFTTNFLGCLFLNLRNRTSHQYFAARSRPEKSAASIAHSRRATSASRELETPDGAASRVPLIRNYLLSALAGTVWYFQFFFYTMGETQMGKYGFASWTLHMASIIIFSTMWGWIFLEWQGCSNESRRLILAGVATLVLSTVIIGYGTFLRGTL